MQNVAAVLLRLGEYEEARDLLERALVIEQAALGQTHPILAQGLNGLGMILKRQGAYAEARARFERALRIQERALGMDHPDTYSSLSNLAHIARRAGALDEARGHFERLVAIQESAVGPDHANTVRSRMWLAQLLAAEGRVLEAWSQALAANASSITQFERISWSLSEAERIRSLRHSGWYAELLVGLARDLGDPAALEVAYAHALHGKGRVGRGLLRDGLRSVAALPEDERSLVQKLRAAQQGLSDALYARQVPDREVHATKIAELRRLRNRLEVDLARLRGARRDARSTNGDSSALLAAFKESLGADAVAIDFHVQRRYEPAERNGDQIVRSSVWTRPHVLAWVVHRDRPLELIDLGEAAVLEQATRAFLRRAIGFRVGENRGVPVPAWAGEGSEDRLRELLWEPLRETIGESKVVFVSGDGFLGGVPFEILVEEDGTFLIERYAFCYQSDFAGLSEALRAGEVGQARLFAAGGIDYSERGNFGSPDSEGAFSDLRAPVSRAFSGLRWTDREVRAVAEAHRLVAGEEAAQVVVRGSDAVEEAIKARLAGFTHIHLATHGFFHPEGVPSAWKILSEQDDAELQLLRESEDRVVGYLPGLLSGLVFAGANAEPEPGRDNGLLTAEEITYLDLTSADLVVLSACETGLGRPEAGEGMIGLRRAFRMAGARTVISSLWEVDDQATRDLMTLFYENLWRRGMPKLEALRQAQLSILEENRKRYGDGRPATWGAFVLDGAPE